MKKIIIVLIPVIFALEASAAETPGDKSKDVSPKKQNTYVLIVSGINKDPEEHQAKDKAVIKLQKLFVNKGKMKTKELNILVSEKSFVHNKTAVSTAENLKKTIAEMASRIKEEDRFIFYYVGQANLVAGNLRINLPGPDITDKELAKSIKQIKASSMLIVLDCPGAGLAVKALSGPGKIIICAARSDQPYSTRFSRFFIPALLDIECDEDGDGRVSLLEAFTRASKQLDDFYREQYLLKTETPLLEDNGDAVASQRPWRYKEDENDGLAASKFFLSVQ